MRRKLVNMLWYDELKRIGIRYGIYSGSTGTHIASDYSGEKLCTCIGWFVRKECKHIRRLLEDGRLSLEGGGMKFVDVDKIVSGKEETKKFRSSLEAINELFEEEAYNSNELFAVCAEPKIGKTLLCVQESVWLASQGYNVLYFDTEGGTASHIRKWLPVFENRFKYDRSKGGKIIFGCEKDLEKILQEFGIKAKIKVKGSKAEFVVDEVNYDKAGIVKVVKENNIDFMVIDSISAPLRVFPSSPQNYPARADCTAIWLTSILKVMEDCNVGTVITAHVTFNPTNPYEGLDGVSIRGGIVMQYYCKRIIYIAKRGKKGLENYRKIWLVRSENIPEWSKVKAVKITDLGYFDVPDEELDKLLTDSEKKRLV